MNIDPNLGGDLILAMATVTAGYLGVRANRRSKNAEGKADVAQGTADVASEKASGAHTEAAIARVTAEATGVPVQTVEHMVTSFSETIAHNTDALLRCEEHRGAQGAEIAVMKGTIARLEAQVNTLQDRLDRQ